MPEKMCPRCGEEYVPRAQVCADCGSPLVWKPQRNAPAATARRDVEVRDQVVLIGTHANAVRLFRCLEDAEIDAAMNQRPDLAWNGFVDVDPDTVIEPGVFEVRVALPDLQRAEEFRDALGLSADEGPGSQEYVEGQCPACGAELPETVGESCPDCGLNLEGWSEEESTGEAGAREEGFAAGAEDGAGGWLPHK